MWKEKKKKRNWQQGDLTNICHPDPQSASAACGRVDRVILWREVVKWYLSLECKIFFSFLFFFLPTSINSFDCVQYCCCFNVLICTQSLPFFEPHGWLFQRLLRPLYEVSHSVCLDWGPAVYIHNRCPGNASAGGSETTLWELCSS